MLKKLGISALLVASASAACWSQSQGKYLIWFENIILKNRYGILIKKYILYKGYPCCSSASVNVVSTDASGSW